MQESCTASSVELDRVLPRVTSPLGATVRDSAECKQALLGDDDVPWSSHTAALGTFYSNHGLGMLGAHSQVIWDDGFSTPPPHVRDLKALVLSKTC